MTSLTEPTPVPVAPLTLAAALDQLAEALASGEAERVLAVETLLMEAVADWRQRASTGGAAGVSVRDIDDARHALARCRRLGTTVPALLSVMFPGQSEYGPSGALRAPTPHPPSLKQRL